MLLNFWKLLFFSNRTSLFMLLNFPFFYYFFYNITFNPFLLSSTLTSPHLLPWVAILFHLSLPKKTYKQTKMISPFLPCSTLDTLPFESNWKLIIPRSTPGCFLCRQTLPRFLPFEFPSPRFSAFKKERNLWTSVQITLVPIAHVPIMFVPTMFTVTKQYPGTGALDGVSYWGSLSSEQVCVMIVKNYVTTERLW